MANTVIGGGGGSMVAGVGSGTADGVYSTAKTSVWWDIENCQVPKAFDAHVIAKNISSALVAMDYRGPVSISAYGDTKLINTSVQQALSSTGISLNHVPGGIKDASDKKILVDMLLWAVDNRPPANYLLISGDRDFSNALHQLSMRRYNILLAQPPNFSKALTTAAKTVWSWNDLLAGRPPLPSSSLTNENGSTSEANRSSSAEERKPSDYLSSNLNLAFQKANANGEVDNQVKGKQQAPKIQKQPNGNKFRRNESNQYHSGSQSITNNNPISQTSNSTISNTEALPNAHTNYLADNPSIPQQSVVNSPHKYISSNKPELKQQNAYEPGAAKVSTKEPYRSNDKVSVPYNFNNSQFQSGSAKLSTIEPYRSNDKVSVSNNFNNNQFRPHSLYPVDIIPPRPYQHSGNFTHTSSPMRNCYPQPTWHSAPPIVKEAPRPQSTRMSAPIFPSSKPNDPSFSSASSAIVPDISKLTNTQYPNAFHSYPKEADIPQYNLPCYRDNMQGNHVSWNHSDPSLVIPSLIDTILPAIHILRKEKIPPTEANITDCIRYGELNIQDFDVRNALELAVQHHAVVKHRVGDNFFYICKGESLWNCVNIMNSQVRYPKEVCDAVLKFLSSTEGHSSMMASRCMYDAASILRRSCLNTLTLGEVLQILYVAIHQKKWILPHSSGWQPLSLPSPRVTASDMNAEPPSS